MIEKVLLIELAAGLLLVAGTALGMIALWPTAALLFLYIAAIGCLYPNTTAMAMASHGARAGSASALVGTLQYGLAAIAAGAVGAANNGTALPMASVIATCTVVASLFYFGLVRRRNVALKLGADPYGKITRGVDRSTRKHAGKIDQV